MAVRPAAERGVVEREEKNMKGNGSEKERLVNHDVMEGDYKKVKEKTVNWKRKGEGAYPVDSYVRDSDHGLEGGEELKGHKEKRKMFNGGRLEQK